MKFTILKFLFFSGIKVLMLTFYFTAYWHNSSMAQETTGNSVLHSGTWLKLAVIENAVYRIDYNWLVQAGLNPSSINPKTIKIYGNGGKMLPQPNAENRPVDLVQNAITVVGEKDNIFNQTDYILFFGQNSDLVEFDTSSLQFNYENNIYSDTTFYFLTYGGENGVRITDSNLPSGDFEVVNTYTDYKVHERELNTILVPGSGRRWFGERFIGSNTSDNFSFDLNGSVSGSTVVIRSVLAGQTFADAEFTISANGTILGTQTIQAVPDVTYGLKGRVSDVSFTFPNTGSTLNINISFQPATGVTSSVGFLDFLFVSFERQLRFLQNSQLFRFPELEGTYRVEIENFNSAYKVWDVSHPLQPQNISYNFLNTRAWFNHQLDYRKEFIMFDESTLSAPFFRGHLNNQNLRNLPVPELLIVTHPIFLEEARRYAQYKLTNEDVETEVVTTNHIYNEFSSGSQDVTAIRDFVRHLYLKQPGKLNHLLLFGKGSYDYKNIGPVNYNLVPTYQSRNSLDNIFSYSSDDYYGFMEEDEGEWVETTSGDHTLEIGIGRLPVKTVEEARAVIDKLISYKTSQKRFGAWRTNIVFVADDQDGNAHQEDAEQLAQQVQDNARSARIDKLYLDAFPQVSTPTQLSPAFNQALVDAIEEGALIINFSGHGGETGWMDERVFQFQEIDNLRNIDNLPLFVTATCEFGRNDDPTRISGGERLILNPFGGAVALITTARPVFRFSNFLLNQALYDAMFNTDANQFPTLGEIIKNTKNNSLRGANNRNFSLLGDPSMRLNYPELIVETEEIIDVMTGEKLDTLKALSPIEVTGFVKNTSGDVITDFNGEMQIRILDKEVTNLTFGTDDDSFPMEYGLRNSILFNGQASVNNGKFSYKTVIPRSIDYSFGKAQIEYYAQSDGIDGSGTENKFEIGGSSTSISLDNRPPEIEIFLNDTLFQNGQATGPSPLFIARLTDENGINTSNAGIGQQISLSIDGSEEIILNAYFISEIDDFTKGWVYFDIDELTPGKHSIIFSASDTYNNRSSASLEFNVGSEPSIDVTSLIVYPNPLRVGNTAEIVLEHNRRDENLTMFMEVYNMNGDRVYFSEQDFINNDGIITDNKWGGISSNGALLNTGMYIVKVTITSLTDGSKGAEANRLVLIN